MSRRGRQGMSWCSSHCHSWRSRWSRSGGRLGRRSVSSGRCCCSGKCGSRGIPPENRALSRFRRSRRLRSSCRGWRQCSRRHESGGWHNSRRRNRSASRARRGCGLLFLLPSRLWRQRRGGSYSRSMSGCRHGCRSGSVRGYRRICVSRS